MFSILPADKPETILLEEVPFFPQKRYQCGPSSLAMVLSWSGLNLTPEDLLMIQSSLEYCGRRKTGRFQIDRA